MTAPPPAQPSNRSGEGATNGSLIDVFRNASFDPEVKDRLESTPEWAVPLPPHTPDALLTPDDVAKILSVPRTLIYSLARRGEIPTVRIGERYVRFRPEALARWIEAQETMQTHGTR